MVGRLNSEMKYQFSSLVIAMMRKKTRDMIEAVLDMGIVPPEIDMKHLYRDVDALRDKYFDVALSQVHLGEAVNDLFTVAFRHQITIPTDLVMLGKSLLSLEGIVEQLDTEISIIDLAEPYGKELLKERLHPKVMAEKAWDNFRDYADLVVEFPQQLKEFLRGVQGGKIRFEIVTKEMDSFLRKIDRVSNQLSFSIILLSFSIIMTGLIIASALGRQPILFWHIPAIDIGFVFAFLMFFLLLISIFRSGRF